MNNSIKDYFLKNNIEFTENADMRLFTSFKIGGRAEFLVFPKNKEEIKNIYTLAEKANQPVFVMGCGTNLLVSDKGIKGIVICLNKFNKITVLEDEIRAEAGVKLSTVCKTALENSLSGIEFAYGIPASVGGAVYMNAGAFSGCVGDIIKEIAYLDSGVLKIIKGKDAEFLYRHSIFSGKKYIILWAVFKLKKGKKAEIKALMDEIIAKRMAKQPLDYPSAGSTFKRPYGYFAAALIEAAGLKGKSVGGAKVSEKHAGFIINQNNATAGDVLALIDIIKNTVAKKDNVNLETEVIFVGEK